MPSSKIDQVIFDVGNVIVDWNPRYLYQKMIKDEAEIEHLLSKIVPMSWHGELDKGKSFATGVAERIALFPDYADLIRAWDQRWPEMIAGPIEGTLAIMQELRAAKIPIYGITNYNHQKFAEDRLRYPFYNWFDDIIISGEVRLLKPDPRIYQLLIERQKIDPPRAIFIDDRADNVRVAEAVGLRGHIFKNPALLRAELKSLGLPLA